MAPVPVGLNIRPTTEDQVFASCGAPGVGSVGSSDMESPLRQRAWADTFGQRCPRLRPNSMRVGVGEAYLGHHPPRLHMCGCAAHWVITVGNDRGMQQPSPVGGGHSHSRVCNRMRFCAKGVTNAISASTGSSCMSLDPGQHRREYDRCWAMSARSAANSKSASSQTAAPVAPTFVHARVHGAYFGQCRAAIGRTRLGVG